MLLEFDNLYLDLNGVIHNASHGNEGVTRKVPDDVIARTCCATIDGIVKRMRPTQLIYLAIDGCAPRAKQNQQRARRTRAAKDRTEAREEAAASGEVIEDADVFDSNCITPGTPFMDMINAAMLQFVISRMKDDPAWVGRRVIFSSSNQPGEGEHKIVEYIRGLQGEGDAMNPNLRHCMVGLDADLVMLSLATHQPHFSLLREHIDFQSFQRSHTGTKTNTRQTSDTKWQLMHIGLLREYLEIDMKPTASALATAPAGFVYDGERVIDDFVLLTVLCGNDFVPHLPSLDIGEGALDELMTVYKEKLVLMGGYICDKGVIDFDCLQVLLDTVSKNEAEVFRERAKTKAKFAARDERDASRDARYKEKWTLQNEQEDEDATFALDVVAEQLQGGGKTAGTAGGAAAGAGTAQGEDDDAGSWQGGEEEDDGLDDEVKTLMPLNPNVDPDQAVKAAQLAAATPASDFKARYYYSKMGIGAGIDGSDVTKARMVASFAEALQWVMLYYYQGVPSWGWFYPFHYAPMTSDLVGLSALEIVFELGQPFKPFEQLMATLPADSAQFLPEQHRWLMTSAESPIADFYPDVRNVRLDSNGKRAPWEAVILVPFIDEKRLLAAIAAHVDESKLTADELRRNSVLPIEMMEHDPTVTSTAVSRTTAFPNVPMCNVSVRRDWKQPSIPAGELFNPIPPVGCVIPAPGYPTLHVLALRHEFKQVKLNIFGSSSRKPSTVVEPMGTVTAGEHGTHVPVFSTRYAPGTSVQPAAGAAPLAPQYEALPKDLYIDLSGSDLRAAATALLGRCVYVEFPHLRAAQVISISTESGEATWFASNDELQPTLPGVLQAAGGGTVTIKSFRPEQAVQWQQNKQQVERTLLSGGRGLAQCGLEVGDTTFLLRVRKLVGMRRDPGTGALHRVFAAGAPLPPGDPDQIAGSTCGDVMVPGQLVLREHPHPDRRWMEQPPMSPQERFPAGTRVVVLRGPHRGTMANVVSCSADGQYVDLEAPRTPQEPPFSRTLAAKVQDGYFTGKQVSSVLGITPLALGRLSGSIIVKPGNFDLGLNLKVQGGKLFMAGYVKSVGKSTQSLTAWASGGKQSVKVAAGGPKDRSGPWVYSERALQLLAAYKQTWPQVFQALDELPDEYSYNPHQLGGLQVVEGALKWLHQLDTFKKPLVDLSTQVLSPVAVKQIERGAAACKLNFAKIVAADPAAYDVRPLGKVATDNLFVPEDSGFAVGAVGGGEGVSSAGADATVGSAGSEPTLGDRVLNLAFTPLPVGAKGVVVATHARSGYVEVVFDDEFVGGSSLEGLCSPGHGGLVQWNELLCLSAPEDGAAERAAAAKAARGWERKAAGGQAVDARQAASRAAAAAGVLPTGKVSALSAAQAVATPAEAAPAPAAASKKAKSKKPKAAKQQQPVKVGASAQAPAPAPAAAQPIAIAARGPAQRKGQAQPAPPAVAAAAATAPSAPAPAPAAVVPRADLTRLAAAIAAILSPRGLSLPLNVNLLKAVNSGEGWLPLGKLLLHPQLARMQLHPACRQVQVVGPVLSFMAKDSLEVTSNFSAVRPCTRGAALAAAIATLGGASPQATAAPAAAAAPLKLAGDSLQPAQVARGVSSASAASAGSGAASRGVGDLLAAAAAGVQTRLPAGVAAPSAAPSDRNAVLMQALHQVGGVDKRGAKDVYAAGPPQASGFGAEKQPVGFGRKRRAAKKARGAQHTPVTAPVAAQPAAAGTGGLLRPSQLLAMARGGK